jgi:hypothetical protein
MLHIIRCISWRFYPLVRSAGLRKERANCVTQSRNTCARITERSTKSVLEPGSAGSSFHSNFYFLELILSADRAHRTVHSFFKQTVQRPALPSRMAQKVKSGLWTTTHGDSSQQRSGICCYCTMLFFPQKKFSGGDERKDPACLKIVPFESAENGVCPAAQNACCRSF